MKNVNVLVVDDDPMTCNLIETILQMESYQTSSINQIDERGIVALLDEHQPDIVIIDFHLGPQEALRYVVDIRASERWQQLPILVTSAIDRRRDSLAAGANDFILKPFNWQDITRSINKLRDDIVCQEA